MWSRCDHMLTDEQLFDFKWSSKSKHKAQYWMKNRERSGGDILWNGDCLRVCRWVKEEQEIWSPEDNQEKYQRTKTKNRFCRIQPGWIEILWSGLHI
ncbi:hypothetical protein CRENBAI_003904 [Crenichthys baileyi]|uniref:Uncharacterized protein n=1 Tax=Crenichthys baileyi TaxID=28760 RepID=A0AAV9QWR3_9TELE